VKTIPQRELRNDNAEIMKAVEAGESFVVTRNGHPVAEIRPYGRRRAFVSRAELRRLVAGAGHIDRGRFIADIDAVVDQTL
jgi:prevent-host-death family protein